MPQNIDVIRDPLYNTRRMVRYKNFCLAHPTLWSKTKWLLRKAVKFLAAPFIEYVNRRVDEIVARLDGRIWTAEQRMLGTIDGRIWKAEQRMLRTIDSRIWKAEKNLSNAITPSRLQAYTDAFEKNLIPWSENEKIRVLFVVQVGAFWPSLEPLYNACTRDNRIDAQIVCYDEPIDKSIKVETTRDYLAERNVPFIGWEDFDVDAWKPHTAALQTPYDLNRRLSYKSSTLKANGTRVVYVPYGIEFPATEQAVEDHFYMSVVEHAWRIYTYSDAMKDHYKNHLADYRRVRALGLPRFDALYHKERFHLNADIERRAMGRKIVLWKVHFPKSIPVKGKWVMVTPRLEEYFKFADMLPQFHDLFFIFMPHPRFVEFNDKTEISDTLRELLEKLGGSENICIDTADDYRPSLVNSDYIMVDRSAVMIEAGSLGVPVLFMVNENYYEPIVDALSPLVDSYYKGACADDMARFLKMCRKGHDPKKHERLSAFQDCIPYFDGKAGERVKEDIIAGVMGYASL
jgi:hypothetical protein